MEQDQTHTITVTRTRNDYLPFIKQATSSVRNLRVYYIAAMIVYWLVADELLDVLTRKHMMPDGYYTYILFFTVPFLLFLFLLSRMFRPFMKREYLNENQNFLRRKNVTITSAGFREASDLVDFYASWEGVDRIEKTKDFLMVYVDRIQCVCIPLRNFETPATADEFYKNMLAYWHAAHGRQEQLQAMEKA